MESMGVLTTAIDVRHEPPVLPSMSSPKQHKPLKHTSSLRPEFFSSPNIRANVAGPSRHMISSPLRTCSPITARVPPPPIDTADTTPTRSGSQLLERVPTEPASAPPPRQQPTADELAVLGIKVRDFAFEPNTLPPVPTVRRPFTFFRDLKRPREETPEEVEARQRNEAKRLEFNSPRRRDETPEERQARRLAFSSPRVNSSLETGLGHLSEGSFFPSSHFNSASSSSRPSFNEVAGPSSSSIPGPGPKARTPLRRQPSERYTYRDSSSTIHLLEAFFAGTSSQRASSPSRTSHDSHVTSAHDLQTRNLFRPPTISLSPFPLESLSQLLPESQSQSQPESQFESQSQGVSSSQAPLPGLSMSQADSEMDDEEYVKTPLVTPSGSLIFDDDPFEVNSLDNINIDRIAADSNNAEPSDNNATNADADMITDGAETIIESSTLSESQVAELLALAPVETGPEQDVSASQMGFESQDSLSQPGWQQMSQSQSQSQSQLRYSSQALLFSQGQEPSEDEDGDVDMPESQPEVVETRGEDKEEGEESDPTPTPTPTLTPRPSFVRTVSSKVISPPRPCASANSNHAASSSQPRPILRHPSSSSLNSQLHRSSSLTGTFGLSRRASLSSFKSSSKGKSKGKTSPVNSTSLSTPGYGRYNLRTPSPKKSKVLGTSAALSASLPTRKVRTRSASGSKAAVSAAAVRRSKSAVQTRRRSREKGDVDVVMGEDAGVSVDAGKAAS